MAGKGDEDDPEPYYDCDDPCDLKLACERFIVGDILLAGVDLLVSRIEKDLVSYLFRDGIHAEESLALTDLALRARDLKFSGLDLVFDVVGNEDQNDPSDADYNTDDSFETHDFLLGFSPVFSIP